MLIKIQAGFDTDDTRTATQVVAHKEMWINPDHIILVSPHPTIFNALEIVYGKDQRRLTICRDTWLKALIEHGLSESTDKEDSIQEEPISFEATCGINVFGDACINRVPQEAIRKRFRCTEIVEGKQ
jgi:hypothetical protein